MNTRKWKTISQKCGCTK